MRIHRSILRFAKTAAAVAAVAALGVCAAACLSACGPSGQKEVELTPTVADSALATPGTLTVGVDSTIAPFGYESDGEIVGIDVDVAAALASALGLELQVIDLDGENPANMLNEHQIDVVMSSSVAQGTNSTTTAIGPYLNNGPALLALSSSEGEVDLSQLASTKIGALQGTVAATTAATYCGTDNLVTYSLYDDAFQALSTGEIQYVAVDAVAGGYLALTNTTTDVRYAASLNNPEYVYMGVLADNTTLTSALNSALSSIEGNGVLKLIITKWVGEDAVADVMPSSESAQLVTSVTAPVAEGTEGTAETGTSDEGTAETTETTGETSETTETSGETSEGTAETTDES